MAVKCAITDINDKSPALLVVFVPEVMKLAVNVTPNNGNMKLRAKITI